MKEITDVMGGKPQAADLSHPDPELYKHLSKVVDAATGSAVTPATALVELYQFSEASVDDTLLRNLTGVARPKPLTDTIGQLLAPTVRLEAHFMYGEGTQRENILTLVLEWHFNNYGNNAPGIRDYSRRDNEISFTAGAATCSGFNNLINRYPHLDERCQEIATLLQSFLEDNRGHRICLRLHTTRLTEDELFQLQKIYTRLPGGANLLLPSIGQAEYSAFGEYDTHIDCASDTHIRRPYHLLQGAAKHPMVPLECGDTFSTVKEAGVQFAYAASAEHAEQTQALKLWSGVPHTGCVYRRGHIFTLGIRFSKYRVLGGAKSGLCLRLPDDLSCKVAMKPLFGDDTDVLEASATLTYDTFAFPPADALFILRGPLTKRETGDVMTWDAVPDSAQYEVHFAPRKNQITFQRQLRTIADLEAPRSSRWHPILLNQVHRGLPVVNLTSGSNSPDQVQAAALQWLRDWQQWNPEQLSVIDALEETKGGMVIVMGPAGRIYESGSHLELSTD
nr:hypothetical protein CFP56_10969 [Quercus suber]